MVVSILLTQRVVERYLMSNDWLHLVMSSRDLYHVCQILWGPPHPHRGTLRCITQFLKTQQTDLSKQVVKWVCAQVGGGLVDGASEVLALALQVSKDILSRALGVSSCTLGASSNIASCALGTASSISSGVLGLHMHHQSLHCGSQCLRHENLANINIDSLPTDSCATLVGAWLVLRQLSILWSSYFTLAHFLWVLQVF